MDINEIVKFVFIAVEIIRMKGKDFHYNFQSWRLFVPMKARA
jgi:hypothetical protein